MSRCCSLFCVLSAGFLSCYFTPEEIDAKVPPAFKVPINKARERNINQKHKQRIALTTGFVIINSAHMSWMLFLQETRIHVLSKESSGLKSKSLSIINPSPEGSQTVVFITDSRDELDSWLDAFKQHLYDQSKCVFMSILKMKM